MSMFVTVGAATIVSDTIMSNCLAPLLNLVVGEIDTVRPHTLQCATSSLLLPSPQPVFNISIISSRKKNLSPCDSF